MQTKHNVRQRRMQKIKRLQDGGGKPLPGPWPRDSYSDRAEYRPVYPAESYWREEGPDAAAPDPEQEWNRKWERDLQRYRTGGPGFGGTSGGPGSGLSRFRAHLLISCLLFASIWGLFQWNHPWAEQGRDWVRSALTEPFDTGKLSAWYEKRFGGAPSFLPALDPLRHQEAEKVNASSKHYFAPLEGRLIAPFTPDAGGVRIEAEAGMPVFAMDTGRVIYAGDNGQTGFTVIIQHADGMRSVYGHLDKANVQPNDWIKGGETVGTVANQPSPSDDWLYFAVSKDGAAVDPADVVTFD